MQPARTSPLFTILALLFFLLGVVLWILLFSFPSFNYGADKGVPFWLFAVASGLVGTVLSGIGIGRERKSSLLVLLFLNVLLLVSPYLMWIIITIFSGP